LLEERDDDAWFDLSLRELRSGEVRFYRVGDPQTGKWLFKVCVDQENCKAIVKAIKCPPGRLFSQLEGATMLFQKSAFNADMYYDVISLTRVDQEGRVRREIVNTLEEVPPAIRENFEVKSYEEVTGKKIPGKNLVSLSKREAEKDMIALFIIERAWTLPAEERQKAFELAAPFRRGSREGEGGGADERQALALGALIRKLQKASIAEIHAVASEQFGIERASVDSLLAALEDKGKVRRLDDNYVKAL
jgi:hypothetical protein